MPPPAEGEAERDDDDGAEDVDWSRLKERWVGWGVE